LRRPSAIHYWSAYETPIGDDRDQAAHAERWRLAPWTAVLRTRAATTLPFAKSGGKADALQPIRSILPKAIERTMDVSYADFKSQVGTYLQPDHLDTYGSREAGDALQMHGGSRALRVEGRVPT